MSDNSSQSLRTYIFRGFLLNSALLAVAVGLLVFATNKLTEDATLKRVLSSEMREDAKGWHSGLLGAMPIALRDTLRDIPYGFHEIDSAGREIAVVKKRVAGNDHYALLVLTETSSLPFITGLLVVCLLALLIALAQSWRLARRFSKPMEQLALRIDARVNPDQTDQAAAAIDGAAPAVAEVQDLAARLTQLELFNRQRLDQERSFAQAVSHELRTPITVIQGALELMTTDRIAGATQARLERMERAVKSMRLTVETLLFLARAERNVVQSDDSFPTALQRVLEDQRELASAGVDLHTRIEGFPSAAHEWGPLLIALQTLLANAVRYTQVGSVLVHVQASGATVRDTGAGMSSGQLHRAWSNQPTGGELGFAIVHRICVKCDWELHIKASDPGLLVSINFQRPYVAPSSNPDTVPDTTGSASGNSSEPPD